jgi:hypothetical protein
MLIINISRRDLCRFSCLCLVSGNHRLCMAQSNATTGVRLVKAEDVNYDGILFDKFSWSWLALKIAEGVLDSVGGRILGSITEALLSNGQPDLGQLLAKQLREFSHLLDNKLQEESLRRCHTQLIGISSIMREYRNAPQGKDRLENATSLSNLLVAELKGFGFAGYRTFLSAAGLHLLILQDRLKLWKGEEANYRESVQEYVEHHKSITKTIDDGTDPRLNFAHYLIENNYSDDDSKKGKEILQYISYNNSNHLYHGVLGFEKKEVPYYVDLKTKVFGVPIDGFVAIYNGAAVLYPTQYYTFQYKHFVGLYSTEKKCIDFGDLRRKIKGDSIDKGKYIIKNWKESLNRVNR